MRGLTAPLRRELPLLLLLGYGGAFAWAAFGRGLPAFDDHPGQYYRLWHFLERSLPSGAWTADWNPGWWGGYPELQFYPPGFALAGAAIRFLGLWQPSVDVVYRILAATVYLLPGVATYALMRRVVSDRWLALPPAFLALALAGDLRGGTEHAVHWGALSTRLAVGWLPLLALSLRPWLEGARLPRWAPPLAALAIVSHPAVTPAVVILLGLATLLALVLRPGRETARQATVLALLSAGLSAFWILPFLLRRPWVIPLTWGDATIGGLLGDAGGRPVLLAILLLAPLAWVAVLLRRRPFEALLAALPVALAVVLLADVWLFALGWSSIEPARLVDGLAASALWAAGLGVGIVVERVVGPRARAMVALSIVILAAVLPDRRAGPPTVVLWPEIASWPSLDEVTARHDLGPLWAALRGPADRVLFLTSSLRLDRDPAWHAAHSHVTSLAPLLTGREIVGGTYTHPSPVAARFYLGRTTPPARIDTLAERLDGDRILGHRWDRLDAALFDDFARRLRIGTVVVPAADARRARFLAPAYAPTREVPGFVVFERRDRPWPRVERITTRRYRVLASPAGGVWIPTGVAAYPLWTVKSAQGRLPTRADPWGLLELRVPVDLFEAELVYSEGWLEWGALAASGLASLLWALCAWRARAPAGGAPRGASGRRRR